VCGDLLVGGEVKDGEIQFGEVVNVIEVVVCKVEHLEVLGLLEQLLDVVGDDWYVQLLEVELYDFLERPLLLDALLDLLQQFATHLIQNYI